MWRHSWGALVAGLASTLAANVTLADPDDALLITDVTVVDVETGRNLEHRDVRIEQGRIRSVTPAGERTGAFAGHVVDGRGRSLIPGLWDMHVHTSRAQRAKTFWRLFLAHGVTGVREMGSYVDSLGAVRPGNVADLVLLEGNPLEDIRHTRHIAAVVSRGRLVDADELAALRAQAAFDAARIGRERMWLAGSQAEGEGRADIGMGERHD